MLTSCSAVCLASAQAASLASSTTVPVFAGVLCARQACCMHACEDAISILACCPATAAAINKRCVLLGRVNMIFALQFSLLSALLCSSACLHQCGFANVMSYINFAVTTLQCVFSWMHVSKRVMSLLQHGALVVIVCSTSICFPQTTQIEHPFG